MLAGRIVPDAGMYAQMRGGVAEAMLNHDAAGSSARRHELMREKRKQASALDPYAASIELLLRADTLVPDEEMRAAPARTRGLPSPACTELRCRCRFESVANPFPHAAQPKGRSMRERVRRGPPKRPSAPMC